MLYAGFRSNNAPSTIPSVRNGNLVNPHDDFPNLNATDNGNLPTADKLVTETNGVSAGNHILSGNNGYLPQGQHHSLVIKCCSFIID